MLELVFAEMLRSQPHVGGMFLEPQKNADMAGKSLSRMSLWETSWFTFVLPELSTALGD